MHGISIEAATLPDGWSERTVAVTHAVGTRGHTGLCLEAHDLAASKLVAYREKDRAFVTTLLGEELIDGAILLERLQSLPIEDDERNRLARWVEITVADLTTGRG